MIGYIYFDPALQQTTKIEEVSCLFVLRLARLVHDTSPNDAGNYFKDLSTFDDFVKAGQPSYGIFQEPDTMFHDGCPDFVRVLIPKV